MNSRLAIIGASYLQLPLILKAQSLGYETHVFAWKADDVGEKAADFFHPVSITEKEKILDDMLLRQLLDKLEEQERRLIELRYFQDQTQMQVAGVLGMSQVQVSRLEKKILLKMRREMLA